MMSNQHFIGGCTCTYIRYQLSSTPLFVHCCHCYWCQRETGSAFVINALIENHHVHILQGEIETVSTPTQSGKGQNIARCPKCHIALWSHYLAGNKKISFVRVGTLDQPNSFSPDIHIYTRSKQPWVVLPSNIPSVPAYYTTSKYWSDASLQRRILLRKK